MIWYCQRPPDRHVSFNVVGCAILFWITMPNAASTRGSCRYRSYLFRMHPSAAVMTAGSTNRKLDVHFECKEKVCLDDSRQDAESCAEAFHSHRIARVSPFPGSCIPANRGILRSFTGQKLEIWRVVTFCCTFSQVATKELFGVFYLAHVAFTCVTLRSAIEGGLVSVCKATLRSPTW